MTNQKSIILLRGLPGSGKTTLAKVLSDNEKYPIHSIDDYFTDKKTGEYKFIFEENYLAYKKCEDDTRKSLADQIEKVFVDNTFTIEWEMEPYFKLASEFGYTIYVTTVENRHGSKNTHDVTNEQLQKMADKYKVKLI
ncbi:MAG: AAA family ATPase [Bacteroidota bacterium]